MLSFRIVRRLRQKPKTPILRDELRYEIKEQVRSSAKILAKERRDNALAAKAQDEWTLGGLTDEEMLAYAMMLSHESTTEIAPDLSQTLTANPALSKQGGVPTDEPLLPSSSEVRRVDDIATTSLMDSDVDWPAIGNKTDNATFADEDDEELQYVLWSSRQYT